MHAQSKGYLKQESLVNDDFLIINHQGWERIILFNRYSELTGFEDDDFFDMEMAGTRPQTMMGNRGGTRNSKGRPQTRG